MTKLSVLKERLLANPEVRAEYERLGPIYELVGALVEARHEAGLTQGQLAEKMGTTQSVVARVESARHMPTFDLVSRYAEAIGFKVNVSLVPAKRSQPAH